MNLLRSLAWVGVGLFCIFLGAGCGDDDEADSKEINVYTPEGVVVLRYFDVVEGKGEPLKKGDEVEVHYTGWLTSGKKFDSSLDRGKPMPLLVGFGKVIQGWNEGIPGMKIGGKRKLFIPGPLAYGTKGSPPTIPPNAKLIFEVEALKRLEPGTVEMMEQMQQMQMLQQQMQMQQRGRGNQ